MQASIVGRGHPSAEVDPSQIDPQINAADRELYMVSCSAIPLVYRASQGLDVSRDFAQVRLKFPHAGTVVDNFERRAAALTSKPAKTPEVKKAEAARMREVHSDPVRVTAPSRQEQPPTKPAESAVGWLAAFEAAYEKQGWLILLLIVGIVFPFL